MKEKVIMFLGVIGLLLAPINAKAVGFEENALGQHCTTGDVSSGKYGTFKAGDICYRYTDETNGIKEWTFTLTTSKKLTNIYMQISPALVSIQDIKVGSDFDLKSNVTSGNDRNVLLTAKSTSGIASDKKTVLFTVTTKDESDKGCSLSASPLELSCEVVGNNYFDKNGASITQAQYDEVCGNTKPSKDPDSPDTGNVFPYIATGIGLVGIAGIYFYNRKHNKLYKL